MNKKKLVLFASVIFTTITFVFAFQNMASYSKEGESKVERWVCAPPIAGEGLQFNFDIISSRGLKDALLNSYPSPTGIQGHLLADFEMPSLNFEPYYKSQPNAKWALGRIGKDYVIKAAPENDGSNRTKYTIPVVFANRKPVPKQFANAAIEAQLTDQSSPAKVSIVFSHWTSFEGDSGLTTSMPINVRLYCRLKK